MCLAKLALVMSVALLAIVLSGCCPGHLKLDIPPQVFIQGFFSYPMFPLLGARPDLAGKAGPVPRLPAVIYYPPYHVIQPTPNQGKQSDDQQLPLIVFLHGSGECGSDGMKQLAVGLGPAIMLNNSRWPCVVYMPQKPEVGKAWEEYDEQLALEIQELIKENNIDPNRVYLTGLSQGGHGTWAIAANHPDMFAAIAPICGYISDKNFNNPNADEARRIAEKIKGLPVWAFHGESDQAVSVEHTRVMLAALKAAGADAKASYYPGVNHNSWDKAYREERLAEWLLEHKRPAPAKYDPKGAKSRLGAPARSVVCCGFERRGPVPHRGGGGRPARGGLGT